MVTQVLNTTGPAAGFVEPSVTPLQIYVTGITPGSKSLTISWGAPIAGTLRSTVLCGLYAEDLQPVADTFNTSYTIAGLMTGVLYYFQIAMYFDTGRTFESSVYVGTPA